MSWKQSPTPLSQSLLSCALESPIPFVLNGYKLEPEPLSPEEIPETITAMVSRQGKNDPNVEQLLSTLDAFGNAQEWNSTNCSHQEALENALTAASRGQISSMDFDRKTRTLKTRVVPDEEAQKYWSPPQGSTYISLSEVGKKSLSQVLRVGLAWSKLSIASAGISDIDGTQALQLKLQRMETPQAAEKAAVSQIACSLIDLFGEGMPYRPDDVRSLREIAQAAPQCQENKSISIDFGKNLSEVSASDYEGPPKLILTSAVFDNMSRVLV